MYKKIITILWKNLAHLTQWLHTKYWSTAWPTMIVSEYTFLFFPHLRQCKSCDMNGWGQHGQVFWWVRLIGTILIEFQNRGAWWHSGRVLRLESMGHGFEIHHRHCVVSLGETHYPLLSTGLRQESAQHDWKIVDRHNLHKEFQDPSMSDHGFFSMWMVHITFDLPLWPWP